MVGRDVILIYHSIAGGCLSIPKANFDAQMNWLSYNAQVVTLDELITTPNKDRLRVVLSFDDGYSTLFDTVNPILKSYSFPAIVYLNTGLLGENERLFSSPELGHYPGEHFLTWSEVGKLARDDWQLGAHGLDHIDLTKCSAKEARRQLVECKAQIEEKIGFPCLHFSYTWGNYSNKVSASVGLAGYFSAVAGLHGPVSKTSNRLALPRLDVRAEYELCDFINVVTGCWDFIGLKQILLRRRS